MTIEEAKHKLDFMKKAYQKLIDEKVDSGKLVGDGVSGEWKAETPLDEAYKSMIDALEMAIKALEPQYCGDCISREETLKALMDEWTDYDSELMDYLIEKVRKLPSVTPQPKMGSSSDNPNKWTPCSERLPEDLEPVNITWVNHNPKGYYADIKDKPFTATGHYCKGRWYWYSSTCQDYLEEYGRCDVDEIDTDIEITAWMPLPKPYKSEIPTEAEGSDKE